MRINLNQPLANPLGFSDWEHVQYHAVTYKLCSYKETSQETSGNFYSSLHLFGELQRA